MAGRRAHLRGLATAMYEISGPASKALPHSIRIIYAGNVPNITSRRKSDGRKLLVGRQQTPPPKLNGRDSIHLSFWGRIEQQGLMGDAL